MKGYTVEPIPYQEAKPWILLKHYAHRMPSISFSFGLFVDKKISGCCSFGVPPNYMECKLWEPYKCYELSRLIINNKEKNIGSFFVSNSIKKLPKPTVIISYADTEMGHIGYIYQATNWLYTGVGSIGEKILILKDGTTKHQRHYPTTDKKTIEKIHKTKGKHRYYFLHGNRKEKKKMFSLLRYPVLPYPKGETKRYDASAKFHTQTKLF